ncbi:methylenetetrahydrofolate reductase [NAD(P)H] [Opitutales bacterium ASA1]|uniref:methylenetetrahydrofolate reductase [NAD(P)H] n=1 Tax=Congregicoccus parvus TaxID=3081749 RepID=UPI002B2FF696|nr:methylenetetrahydrofolate reductase [NAD(P)H] [Opitutales bacterium ASA1]
MTIDPRIDTLLAGDRPLRSLEFFPPKDDAGIAALRQTAEALKSIEPAFVSVTYGAGGSTRERTAQVSNMLREEFGFAVMPHLTCVNHTRAEIVEIARAHHARGIRNIMALRGDVPKGLTAETAFKDGLRYGSDIVALLRDELPDICSGVGGYPEKHPEAVSLETDIDNLRRKVDAGAGFVTTQLFFENDAYFRFVERCRRAGITIPILPGIMPALSTKSIQRMTELCGASLPSRLARRLAIAGDNAEVVEFVGIEWAVVQIRELLAAGVPGYHLYILNRAKSALALAAGLAD